MNGSPTFTVVIPTARASSLPAAIRSVYAQTFTSWELVLVGQAEDSAVRAAVQTLPPDPRRLRYVHIPVAGLSRARNTGLAQARGEVIAFMDDDCEAAPNWLAVLAAAFSEHPDLEFIGGSMLAPPKPAGTGLGRCPHWEPPELLYDPLACRHQRPPEFGFVGGNFAFRRTVIDKVGLFDPCLGVGGVFPAAEDTDYLLRLDVHGIKMLSTPRSIVHHSDGWRYGLASVLRHQRGRGIGNGALAAKRTMIGDPQGRKELLEHTTDFRRALLRMQRPEGAWYVPHFWLGYRRCMRHYTVDAAGLLSPRRVGR
jgi:glycosyltransferase involved in cell wall biosynthesis